MTKNLIFDTNVFYNLGSEALRIRDIVSPGEHVFYSPVSVLELAGKWSDRTHEDRQSAAQAILDSNAQELEDPESFMTSTFGYTLKEPPFSVAQGVVAMAKSSNMAELQAGVRDFRSRLVRRVSITNAASWRSTTESKWVNDIIAIMEKDIPRFKKWYDPNPAMRRGQVPRLRGKAKKDFLARTKTDNWICTLILAYQHRAFFKAKRGLSFKPTRENVEILSAAIDKVGCYCGVYTQYLVRALTQGALPKRNDSGDLELFTYAIDDNYVVVTSEKKWVTMAEKAGYSSRVRRV